MQPNEITLTVDEANDGSTTADVDYVYRRLEESNTRSLYIDSVNHAIDDRSMFGFYRTTPKPNGNFKGVKKVSAKFTKDISVVAVDGVSTITSPIITEVKLSIPVGATDAQVMKERQKVIALLDTDSIMTPLCDLLEI